MGYIAREREIIRKIFCKLERTIKGSFQHAAKTGLEDLQAVDLIVCGSATVTEKGVRVGKCGGYSDLK